MAKCYTMDNEGIAAVSQDRSLNYWAYNGMDCCITHEVCEKLYSLGLEDMQPVYRFVLSEYSLCLRMMTRGILIDQKRRSNLDNYFTGLYDELWQAWAKLCQAYMGKTVNPNSSKQLAELFYERLGLEHCMERRADGSRTPSTGRNALEAFAERSPKAALFANFILKMRDLGKKLEALRAKVDSDSRMRTSFNPAGTETLRWSSRKSCFGTGDNIQNKSEELRRIYVADPGYKLAYIDLEQAESRIVGLLAWLVTGKSTYLDACESGDLHTLVAKMCWQELAWQSDPNRIELSPGDKKVAQQVFYRDFSYRFMSKRLGHGSNYGGTPWTMAKHAKMPKSVIESFQDRYFGAFDEIPEWHKWVKRQLAREGHITSILGFKRIFFGRSGDRQTINEAIAFEPQHICTMIINIGLKRLDRLLNQDRTLHELVQPLAQGHDAALVQYREDREDELLPWLTDLFQVPMTVAGRDFVIPTGASIGWNWQEYRSEADAQAYAQRGGSNMPNFDGLIEWEGGTDDRERTEQPSISLLDRELR